MLENVSHRVVDSGRGFSSLGRWFWIRVKEEESKLLELYQRKDLCGGGGLRRKPTPTTQSKEILIQFEHSGKISIKLEAWIGLDDKIILLDANEFFAI